MDKINCEESVQNCLNGVEESGTKNAQEILTGAAMKKCFDRNTLAPQSRPRSLASYHISHRKFCMTNVMVSAEIEFRTQH